MNSSNQEKRIINKQSMIINKAKLSFSTIEKEEMEKRSLKTFKKFIIKIQEKLIFKKKLLTEIILKKFKENKNKNSQYEYLNDRIYRLISASNNSTTSNSNNEIFKNTEGLVKNDFESIKKYQESIFEVKEYEKENYFLINKKIILEQKKDMLKKFSLINNDKKETILSNENSENHNHSKLYIENIFYYNFNNHKNDNQV